MENVRLQENPEMRLVTLKIKKGTSVYLLRIDGKGGYGVDLAARNEEMCLNGQILQVNGEDWVVVNQRVGDKDEQLGVSVRSLNSPMSRNVTIEEE